MTSDDWTLMAISELQGAVRHLRRERLSIRDDATVVRARALARVYIKQAEREFVREQKRKEKQSR